MDPEYNSIINKLEGKHIMEVAEKCSKVLSKDQYGSRKYHKSSNCCLNKVCLMDLSSEKLTHRCVGRILMNILKGCYDWIIHTSDIGTTCIWFIWITQQQSLYMMEMLQVTQQRTRSWIRQLMWTTALWCLISSPLIKVMQKMGNQVESSSSLSLFLQS